MTWNALLSFVLLCLLLNITPGPDTFLILRYALRDVRTGIAAGIGSSMGYLLWAAAIGLGLAALMEQSATAYRIVKVAGGLYLLYLGVVALIRLRRAGGLAKDVMAVERRSVLPALGAGFMSTSLNPKVGLFFIAVVPQFLPAGNAHFMSTIVLGAISALCAVLYLVALSLVSNRAVAWLRRPKVTKALERTSAGVLAAFGIATLAIATQ